MHGTVSPVNHVADRSNGEEGAQPQPDSSVGIETALMATSLAGTPTLDAMTDRQQALVSDQTIAKMGGEQLHSHESAAATTTSSVDPAVGGNTPSGDSDATALGLSFNAVSYFRYFILCFCASSKG